MRDMQPAASRGSPGERGPALPGTVPLLTRAEFRARVRPPGGPWRHLWATFTPAVALGFLLIVGGLASIMPLAELGARLGVDRYLPWWWVFPVGWGVMLAALPVLKRDAARQLRRRGLICPHCGEPLVGTSLHGGTARHELVMATGRCPHCGAAVLHPAA